MAKGAQFDTDVLALILNGTTISGLAQNAPSPLTTLFLALHTADPGSAGDQTVSEATYTGYGRVSVNRDPTGWSVSSGVATLVADAVFGTVTAGTGTLTFYSLGTTVSGAGKKLWSGPITPNIVLGVGVTPRLLAGTTITET